MSAMGDPQSAFEKADKVEASKNATDDRESNGRFSKGWKGGPGRRVGSRKKLAEQVFSDTLESWEKHGVAALDRLAVTSPKSYLGFVSKLIPTHIMLEHATPMDGMTDEDLAQMLAFAQWQLAQSGGSPGENTKVIEHAPRVELGDDLPLRPAARREALMHRDLEDQTRQINNEPVGAVIHPLTTPYPVGPAPIVPDRERSKRNIRKLHDDIDPESLF